MVKVQNISLLLLSALSASNTVVFGLIPLIDGGKGMPSEYFFIFALANVKIIKTYIHMYVLLTQLFYLTLLTSHHNTIWFGIYYKTTNRDVWGVL